jgi:hypothetical protein
MTTPRAAAGLLGGGRPALLIVGAVWRSSRVVAAMIALIGGLLFFLREIAIATARLRIGPY